MPQVDPLFAEDFRNNWSPVLWRMMLLRWCDARWDRPKERAQLEARLAVIESKALRLGLKSAMEQAASDNAQQMATMRLDNSCRDGFDAAYRSAAAALTEIEGFLARRAKQVPAPGGKAPPQDVHIAYLGVESRFFALRECREESIVKAVQAQRRRFEEIENQLVARIGTVALTSLRDYARMQLAVIMVQPCAGERGLERLVENLDRLAALAAKPKSG